MRIALGIIIFLASSVSSARAPRCLDEKVVGLTNHRGEFHIVFQGSNKATVIGIVDILRDAGTEISRLNTTWRAGKSGNTYFNTKIELVRPKYLHDATTQYEQMLNEAINRAYFALDKIASIPNVDVNCDLFLGKNGQSDLLDDDFSLGYTSWQPFHQEIDSEKSEAIIQALLDKKLAISPYAPKTEAWFSIDKVFCKASLPVVDNVNGWTCALIPAYGQITIFSPNDFNIASVLFRSRAEVIDWKGMRTLEVTGLFCQSKLNPETSKLENPKCQFDIRQ